MTFEWDDHPPSYPTAVPVATPTPQSNERVRPSYYWLERYIPYNNSAESNIHWFKRFED